MSSLQPYPNNYFPVADTVLTRLKISQKSADMALVLPSSPFEIKREMVPMTGFEPATY